VSAATALRDDHDLTERCGPRRGAQAGAVPRLVRLLREYPNEVSAELAAVALRNLALANAANRAAIAAAGGLGPLLRLLATGQERLAYALPCQARPPLARQAGLSALTGLRL